LALDAAAQALANVHQPGGNWERIYYLDPPKPPAPTTEPTTEPAMIPGSGVFASRGDIMRSDSYDLEPQITTIGQLKAIGRERYATMIAGGQFTFRQHLAAAICGLLDEPLTLELPVSRAEIAAYLKQHQNDWAQLSGPVPDYLQPRLKRLWLLLIRSRLERLESAGQSPGN
jgi:hypothetical protein